VSRG
jgi:hypothetical protein